MHPCDELITKISLTLFDDAPVNIHKEKASAAGVHLELDELRDISNSGKQYLDQMPQRETEHTGIASVTIAFNNDIGYYMEVRHTNKDKVTT